MKEIGGIRQWKKLRLRDSYKICIMAMKQLAGVNLLWFYPDFWINKNNRILHKKILSDRREFFYLRLNDIS
jgi:hypothetical protein